MSGFSHTIFTDLTVSSADPTRTGFNETLVVQPEPTAQGTFVHGINDILFVTGVNGVGGSVGAVSGSMVMHSGNSTTGSVFCAIRRATKYRPGEDNVCRIAAVFGPPVSGTAQSVGLANVESGYLFSYFGDLFGILHIRSSGREIRTLTITTGVSSTTNITVTLSGATITVPVAGGSNTFQTAARLAEAIFINVGTGWHAEAYGNSVRFVSIRSGPQNGTFSAAGTGLVSSFARTSAGIDAIETFIPQSQWNIDVMDGTGPSRFNLNQQTGNVYQTQFRYLGYGNATFSIEDSRTGKLTPCHMIKNIGSNTSTVLRDPQVHATWSIVNIGSSIGTHMTGSSAGTFTEGRINRNLGISFSGNSSKSAVTTAVPILSVRSNRVFRGKGCYGEIDFRNIMAAGVTGGASTRSTRIFLYKNISLTGPTNWTDVDASAGRSIASTDTASTGFTVGNGYLARTYLVTNGQTILENLVPGDLYLSTGETLTIVAEATDSSTVDASLSWHEDQ